MLMVNTLYRFMSLLNSVRYSANENCAVMQSTSPHMLPTLAFPSDALVIISITAPQHPRATPHAFFHVTGSFSMIAASMSANIGDDVVMMLALDGEVIPSPMVKQHWLNTSAKSPAAIIIRPSFSGTCSFFAKSEAVQNSAAPPMMRNDTRLMPSMPFIIAVFPMGAISPHMTHAPSMLR